jgi:hypothetical protein
MVILLPAGKFGVPIGLSIELLKIGIDLKPYYIITIEV